MAQNIVKLNETNRKSGQQDIAKAAIDQMFAYFDAMETRFPAEDTLPQAA